MEAIQLAKSKGFRVSINCTLFNDADPAQVADFFDEMKALGLDGITVSPGYAYERAPDQQHFLNRTKTKELFRGILARGNGGRKWPFSQSIMFLNFLAGNEAYHCTPWGNPTRTVFGWQKPCYLLGEGYAKTFRELMDDTEWDKYGVGNYEKCADCMVHSGFEASAVTDMMRHPLKALSVAMRGVRTDGAMAKDISLEGQRPAEFVFSGHVERKLAEIRTGQVRGQDGGSRGVTPENARSASRPVRIRAGSWPGFASRARRTAGKFIAAIRLHADVGRRRQRMMRGIGDNARHGERQAMPLRHPRRDMRFHVDRDGAGRAVQRRLLRRFRHHGIRAQHESLGRLGQASGQPARPQRIGRYRHVVDKHGSARTHWPARNPGASPPAMPMLMIPRAPTASRSSTASSRAGSPPPATASTSGPATMRRSRCRPVAARIITYRARRAAYCCA